jgi:hypothetical protein
MDVTTLLTDLQAIARGTGTRDTLLANLLSIINS